jgi:hypothetical protein
MKIMGRLTLNAAERDIFHAVRRWVEANVEGWETGVSEDIVLSCVRLRDLLLDELVGTVRESKLVSDSSILDAVKKRLQRKRGLRGVDWYDTSICPYCGFIRSRRLWSSLHGLGRIGAISQVTLN